MNLKKQRTVQEAVTEMSEELEKVLEWSKTHPGRTLREMEEEVQGVMTRLRARLLKEVVAQQGNGKPEEERCSCGGKWVFHFRERQVMTTQGVIRVKRAYFTCERCGAGFSPLDRQLETMEGWSEMAVEEVLWTAQAVSSYREAESFEGKEAFGEGAAEWVEEMKGRLWQGEVEAVAEACTAVLAGREDWSEEVARTADYFRERVRQMRYPEFRAAGYPIGSGTVESGCKGIAWRCKNRGQRWKSRGLVAILALRSTGMGEAKEWDWGTNPASRLILSTGLGHTPKIRLFDKRLPMVYYSFGHWRKCTLTSLDSLF